MHLSHKHRENKRGNYIYANLFKQHYPNPFLYALIWIIKTLPQDISYFRRGMMMMMKMVMLGAGVVKGQGFPPTVHPSVSPNDQRYICTWMRYCLWTDWIVIVKQEGSLFFTQRPTVCSLQLCFLLSTHHPLSQEQNPRIKKNGTLQSASLCSVSKWEGEVIVREKL